MNRRGAGAPAAVGDELVWYVSYGSNLHLGRLQAYLRGGTVEGNPHRYLPARDTRDPLAHTVVALAHPLVFRGHSRRWGGGTASLDLSRPGLAHGVAWLVRRSQLEDLCAQENGLAPPGPTLAVPPPGAVHEVAALAGRYRWLAAVEPLDGRPALAVLTSPDEPDRAPSPAYAAVVRQGLCSTVRLSPAAADAYLRAAGAQL